MSLKINTEFLEAYIELDKACCEKLELDRGGVSEYINRLRDCGFASNRDELLKTLIKYRKLRNILAHEEGALSNLGDISKSDIIWIRQMTKKISKGKDPVTAYNRRARAYSAAKSVLLAIKITAVIAVIVGVILLLKALGII